MRCSRRWLRRPSTQPSDLRARSQACALMRAAPTWSRLRIRVGIRHARSAARHATVGTHIRCAAIARSGWAHRAGIISGADAGIRRAGWRRRVVGARVRRARLVVPWLGVPCPLFPTCRYHSGRSFPSCPRRLPTVRCPACLPCSIREAFLGHRTGRYRWAPSYRALEQDSCVLRRLPAVRSRVGYRGPRGSQRSPRSSSPVTSTS